MEKNLSIKSLDELHKLAVDNDDLESHIKLLISEVEQKIIEAIQTGLSFVIIPIMIGDYQLLTYNQDDSTKIIVYNIMKVLSNNKYIIKLKKLNNGYHIIIDISNRSGSKLTGMLNDYLNKFL